ncbi:lysophospholipid acyltransferase family protein [soil metagenome]
MGLVIATVLDALVVFLLVLFVSRSALYQIMRTWAAFVIWWAKVICGIKYVVVGSENIPSSNAIILSNHQSTWETIAFVVLLPRPQSWVLKRELLNIPFYGWGLRLLQPIAIDRSARSTAREQIITIGTQRLQQGRWILIYPQGTRVKPKTAVKFSRGGALLAASSGYPVIPVAHNAGSCWPRRGFIKKPGTIRVVIGPAINSIGLSAETINHQAQQWVQATLERIE